MTEADADMKAEVETREVAYVPDMSHVPPELKAVERRLVMKLDILIVGITSLVFLVNQWDKGNIGNARVMGIQKDLNISDSQFYNIISLYYVGYVLCTLPANVSIRWFGAHRQIGGAVILFAMLSCCMAAAKNAATILALRILFGFVSAGLQALALYTTLWYQRNELATRTAAFYGAATIAGGFSGLISYAVQKNLDGALGKKSWQWLFIIQGCAGMFVGIVAWALLPPAPDQIDRSKKHWMFTEEELDVAMLRLKSYNKDGAAFEWKQVIVAAKDPKTYFFSIINMGVAIGLASVGAFLPSFISQFGYTAVRTQLFTVIPYACAFVVMLCLNIFSDRTNIKGPTLIFAFTLNCVGYIMLLVTHDHKVKMAATCFITMGIFPCVTLIGAWTNINTAGFTKRAVTSGATEVIAQCWSILASHIYTDPPQYIKGHSIVLSFQVLSIITCFVAIFWMRRLNRKKAEENRRHDEAGTVHPMTDASLEEVYDFHPLFKYII